MDYSNSIALKSDPQQVLAAASTILMASGFSIVQQEGQRVEFAGPGLNSTRQNAILGASQVTLDTSQGQLRLDANLGGVDSMNRFITRFPLLLGLGLGCLFAVLMLVALIVANFVGANADASPPLLWFSPLLAFGTAMVSVSPWFFLAPRIRRKLEQSTTAALDNLMNNAVCAGSTNLLQGG